MNTLAPKKAGLIIFLAMLSAMVVSLSAIPAGAPVVHADPKGIKFLGALTCNSSKCHGADINPNKKADDKDFSHDENTIWEKQDGHSRAYDDAIKHKKGLLNKESAKIAKALKIANPTTSERCLGCHALSGFSNGESKARIALDYTKDIDAESVQKKLFLPSHGVSCDGCHGPSATYNQPHQTAGWTDKMRKQLGSEKLYDQWGIYDTKNLKMRANQCVSCHLKIDPDMVAAGHPELPFELDSMSHGEWMHWRPNGDYFGVKAWAMGQFVSMREAALQLAERVSGKADKELIASAYKQLAAQVLMARHAAKFIAPALEKEIETHMAAVHANWADAAKVDAELHALGKTADALADELNKQVMAGSVKGKEFCDAMLKDVAAEGEAAAKIGFAAAFQYAYSMTALVEADFLKGAPPEPSPKAMKAKTKADEKSKAALALAEALGDSSDYKAEEFLPLAKKMMELAPGGTALALPGNGPVLK